VPGRHLFDESDTVYLSFWVKYSTNFVGSGHSYHPHEFHFITNKDTIYVGPAGTHLTTYMEQIGGKPSMAIQDKSNVNSGCIVRNNDPVDACDQYNFGEDRSVASCNGIQGDLDTRDCFESGGWYSSRGWNTDDIYFKDEQGPYYKNDWHFIETMWEMNSIVNGIGQVDAKLRYWYDGELLISSDNIILRTGVNADMHFNQFLTGFYIGDGSPVTQTMWVDNLTVSTHRLGYSSPVCGDTNCDNSETCETCPADCGACGSVCGDGDCGADEDCTTCPTDCGTCPVVCGDGTCDASEDCTTCEVDCDACPCTPIHDSDNNPCDGVVSTEELAAYINEWKAGAVSIQNLMGAIIAWKG